jgi:hypothetical protein
VIGGAADVTLCDSQNGAANTVFSPGEFLVLNLAGITSLDDFHVFIPSV